MTHRSRWGRQVDGDKGKDVGAGEDEDENVGLNEDAAGKRGGGLDLGWNFSWNECRVSDEKKQRCLWSYKLGCFIRWNLIRSYLE